MDSTQFYERIANSYARIFFNDFSDREWIESFLKNLPPKSTVLDAGCGPGQFTKYLSEKGYAVQGVDVSPKMLQIAKEKFSSGKFTKMDLRSLSFPNNHFHGILAAYSLIHFSTPDFEKVLSEFNRVLEPNGLLLGIFQEGEGEKEIDEPLLPGEKLWVHFWSKKTLLPLLEKHGFSVTFWGIRPSKGKEELDSAKLCFIARKKAN